MASYYEGHPDPDDSTTWGGAESFDDAKSNFESAKGPAPTPSPVAGPPSPGAGMPAARVGDQCAHGGAILGPGAPTVLIGNMPAVRAMAASDTALCPMFDGVVPHVSGVILKGSNSVLIANFPAARVADPIGPPAKCAGNQIAKGCDTVLIGDSGGGGGGGGGGDGFSGGGGGEEEAEQAQEETSQTQSEYTEGQPAEDPPGESTQNVAQGTHWLEIEMVDEAEQPVVGERYEVTLPDSKVVKGGLDSRGMVRLQGIKNPGACRIQFPNLDLAAWERWRPMPPQTESPEGAPAPAPPLLSDEEEGPVEAGPNARNGKWRTVMQGECISSIARETGHFWTTIWDHGSNAELKRRRSNPNALLPGDAVFVPDKRPREESGNVDQRHKFRRKGEPTWFKVQLLQDGEPRANEEYKLDIDGKPKDGTTDDQGRVKVPIRGDTRRIILRIGSDTYRFTLGVINPLNDIAGIQMRLANLGFPPGRIDGIMGPKTLAALNQFRISVGLPTSSELDNATIQKLNEAHDAMKFNVIKRAESEPEIVDDMPGTAEGDEDSPQNEVDSEGGAGA